MKIKNEKDKKEAQTVHEEVAPADAASEKDFLSELNEPLWSVVNFESCLESGLKYDEAARKMAEFSELKISGLCILTDEAAARINKK